jgi:uncharacterized membrane protein
MRMTDSSQSPDRPTKRGHLHPTVLAEAERRSADVQLRVADLITKFAGSMRFVYLHAVIFAVWMLFVEKSPWPTLTLVVSLEAIFLSTFVMIGQNRQADFQQHKADHDFVANEQELGTNTELTKQIAELTREIHARVRHLDQDVGAPDASAATPTPSAPAPGGPVPGAEPPPTDA